MSTTVQTARVLRDSTALQAGYAFLIVLILFIAAQYLPAEWIAMAHLYGQP